MAAMCPECQFSDDYSYDGTLSDVSLNDNYDNLGSTFFGYVVSNNSIVQNYVCGNIGGNAFCLRGEVDVSGSTNLFYENNSDILTHFFGNICSTNPSGMSCENSDDGLFIYNYLEASYGNTSASVQTYDDCWIAVQTGSGTVNNCS